ncbi:MAG: glycosyl hydrolase family 18 protein [Saprospiraceae bacterium]
MRPVFFFYFAFFSSFLLKAQTLPCKEVIGYYPNWQWYDRSKLVKPSSIDYSKYTIINYAFFKPESSGNISSTDTWADENLLKGQPNWAQGGYYPNTSIISLAHNSGVKVLPSIGGWTLSDNFPIIAADPQKRANFANSCVQLINQYGFDGIDLDWEYPGYVDHGGSAIDKNNFTLLLQAVRTALNTLGAQNGKSYLLTSCFGASQSHMNNIDWSAVAPLLDCINLMSYDFFGAWDNITNHNAPLYAPAQGDQTFNISSAVNALLITYNVPPQKICAGLPFYGRSFKTPAIPALHGAASGTGDTFTFADDDGTPLYYNVVKKMNLFDKYYDNLAASPYLLGKNGLKTFLSYDDSSSIATKAAFIKTKNLRGCIIWEITGDYLETFPGSGVISGTPLASAVKNVFCSSGNSNVCTIPTQIAVVSQSTSASVTWTSNSASSYDVQYKLTASNTWNTQNVNSNNVVINNLAAGQSYQLQIRSVCSPTLSSLYSNPLTFNTLSAINQNPVVSIIQPSNNQTYFANSTLSISASAYDPDGTVSKVEFYQGTQFLGVDYTAPYTFNWNAVPAGNYQLFAKAFDNLNASANSSNVNLAVIVPTAQCIITNPVHNGNFTLPTDVTINVKVNTLGVPVSTVNLYINGTILKSIDVAPYQFVWTKIATGTYTISAEAITTAKTSIVATPVTINILPKLVNIPPTSEISQPVQNSNYIAPAQILIVANAADVNGYVSKVDFFAGSILIGTDYIPPFMTNWNAAIPGTYSITATATDNHGASTASKPVQIVVKANAPPICSIQAPIQNQTYQAPANVLINALANDSDGIVTKVDFYNGSQLLGTKNVAPYSFSWQNVSPGSYVILAKATDNKGGIGVSSSVTITVQNAGASCSQYQNYVEAAPYSTTSIVTNNGGVYKCNIPGWCSGAGWAYAPGTGTAWQDAWTKTGNCTQVIPDCSLVNAFSTTSSYQTGAVVKNISQVYSCNIPSWCSSSPSFYAPGTGSAWQQAWTLLGPCPNGSSRIRFDSNQGDLLLYPNPANESIFLKIPDLAAGTISIKVMDVNSRVVLEKDYKADAGDFIQEINISNLTSGIYEIQVETSSWVKGILLKKVN